MRIIILLLIAGAVQGQLSNKTYPTSIIQWNPNARYVSDLQILRWNDGVNVAKAAAAAAAKQIVLVGLAGISIRKSNDSLFISGGQPAKLTIKQRDLLNLKDNRGTFIYNLDKDVPEYCNGLMWIEFMGYAPGVYKNPQSVRAASSSMKPLEHKAN